MLPVTSISGPDSETWVVITAYDETTVTLTSPAYTTSRTFVVGAENSTNIALTPQVMYGNSSAVEHKGIQVVADLDVSVQVVTSISGGNTESYQALPKTVWSDEYYASLYTVDTGESSFLTIAAYDDDTSVDITIHTLAGPTSCRGMTLDDGETLTKTLASMDVWGVRCDKDLTGTYIKSRKAISVVAGIVGANRFFMEMMIPVQLYGVNFVLPNIPDVAIVFRVLASDDDTEVNTWNSTYTLVDKGSYMDIDRRVPEIMCINTSKPVQVQMLLRSPDSSVTSFMMTIAPVERYVTTVRIPPSPVTVSQRLMIYVTEKSNKLSLESELQHVTVVEESGCCNYVSIGGSENADKHFTLNLLFPVMILQYSVQLGGVESHSAEFNMSSLTCPTEKGYQYHASSKFCFKVRTARAGWSESVQLCESWLHHHLATLDSQEKNTALKRFMRTNFASNSVWTGGKVIHGSQWRWPNNGTISKTSLNWAQDQPDGSSSCLALYWPFGHKWDDLTCAYRILYACELRLEALPSVRLHGTHCSYENQTCPSGQGYSYFPDGDLCIKPYETARNWTMANSQCQAHGDRLVKVDSPWKATLITSFAESHLGSRVFFIGGSRQNTSTITNSRSEDFMWTDCNSIGSSLWRVNEPNNGDGDENCLLLDDEVLNDIRCTNVHAFICEKTDETQLVSDVYDESCLEQTSSTSSSFSVDLQPSSLLDGDGSISVSSDAGVTPDNGASSVMVSTPSVPATVSAAFSPTSVDAVSLVAIDTASSEPPTMMATAALIPKSSDSSVPFGTGSILVSPSDVTTISATSADADAASTTTIATGHTIFTAPSLTPVSTTAALTPSPTTASAALPTTSITSTSPDVTPPGEWNISSWDKNWDLTIGPWKSDPVSGRWKRLLCRCACVPQRLKALSSSGVEAVKENIESKLLLDNKNLTKKAAKYSSAKDDRTSARGMGYSVI
ncbi:uncharacterized protein [Haliotis asinina]|uniref:uncharacterized protein n=1 Tax=Haliotis asinina TaxID=109174 RepID=UPI003531A22C